MFLYDPKAHISFQRYGIAIPSLDSRKTHTLESLMNHPVLGPKKFQWLQQGITPSISREDLERAHDSSYIAGFYGEALEHTLMKAYELINDKGQYFRYDPLKADLPLTDMLDTLLRIISGTYTSIVRAKEKGFCYFMGGGMHHGHREFGHGFCPLNDIAVAVLKAKAEGKINRIWVLDLDAHRGDGTAELLSEDKDLVTLSIHMAHGWPLDVPEYNSEGKRDPGWFPGDVDIPVDVGEEEFYLPRLKEAMIALEEKPLPDLALVLAGADPYEKDELPSTSPIRLSRDQLLERDQMVYTRLEELKIPSAWVAAGGYGSRSWEIHSQFLRWILPQRLH